MSYKNSDKKLLNAARNKDDNGIEELALALQEKANINVRDIRIENEFNWIGYRYTPLMWAAHNGQIEKVKFLIEHGADVYATTGRNNTALHIAAREGHVDVLNYLAGRYPELLYQKGEYGFTPEEIAVKYKKNEEIVDTFQTHYSNSFFSTAKMPVPDEIAMLVTGYINDPISLKNLSMVNKAWKRLFEDEFLQDHYSYNLRTYLPDKLRKVSWEEIFHFYYPHTPMPADPLKGFIKRMHTFYAMGTGINTLMDKTTGEQVFEFAFAFGFIIAHQGDMPSSKKQREIPDQEIENNIKNALAPQCLVTAYRELHEISKVENEEGINSKSTYKLRKPVVEIVINSETALALLADVKPYSNIHGDDIVATINWRMCNKKHSASEQAEIHELNTKPKN